MGRAEAVAYFKERSLTGAAALLASRVKSEARRALSGMVSVRASSGLVVVGCIMVVAGKRLNHFCLWWLSGLKSVESFLLMVV